MTCQKSTQAIWVYEGSCTYAMTHICQRCTHVMSSMSKKETQNKQLLWFCWAPSSCLSKPPQWTTPVWMFLQHEFFVTSTSSALPCCRLCMYVLSLTFFFSLPLLSSTFPATFACNQCTLSPCCYCRHTAINLHEIMLLLFSHPQF